jgi:hypothetical protein
MLPQTDDLALTRADTDDVDRLARGLCLGEPNRVDAPEWVARARHDWDALPLSLRRGVRSSDGTPVPEAYW